LVVDADDRDVPHARQARDDVLDLAREDVLAAGDEHLVLAAVDEQAALRVEMSHVARRGQAVEDGLAAAAV
jgi:hypothetical protein